MTVMVTRTEVRDIGDERVKVCLAHWVWCPACSSAHRFRTAVDGGLNEEPLWGWDGNAEAPTFEGSMLVKTGPDFREVCHSFLRAGEWEFLSDCTHELAGQRAPMAECPDWLR